MIRFRKAPRLRACTRAVLNAYFATEVATEWRTRRAAAPGAALLVAGGLLAGGAAAQTTCPNITASNQSISITGVESAPCTNTGTANTITIAPGAGLVAGGSTVTSFTVGRSYPNLVGTGTTVLINNGTIGASNAARSIDYFQSGTGTSNSPSGTLTIENNGTIVGQIRQVIASDGSLSGGGGGYSAPLTIINTGQILANAANPTVIADFTQNNGSQNFLLNNSGLIRGNLDLRHSPDMVINSGTIEGNIDFGLSDQRQGSLVLRPGSNIIGTAVSRSTSRGGRVGATLSLSGEGGVANSFNVGSIGTVGAPDRTIQGFAHFFKEGPSTWTLTGSVDPTYTVPVTGGLPTWWVSGGRLVGSSAAVGGWSIRFGGRATGESLGRALEARPGDPDFQATAGTVATFEFRLNDVGAYGGVISQCNTVGEYSGTCAVPIVGRVEKTGTGTLTLTSTTNNYAGGTTIRQGVLAIAGDGSLGAATGGVDLAGGTLRTASSFTSTRLFTVSAASGIDVTAGTLALSTGLAGNGALSKSGAGTLALNAAGSYGGELTLAQGTLTLGVTGALGSGSLRTTGSVVDYAAGITNNAPIIVDSNSTQLQVASGSATQAGAISELGGARPLEKIGAGTLVLGNDANSYSGGTTVSAGTLAVATNGALGAVGGGLILAGSTLRIDGSFASARALTVSGGSALDIGTHTLTWSGSLGGSGSLSKLAVC